MKKIFVITILLLTLVLLNSDVQASSYAHFCNVSRTRCIIIPDLEQVNTDYIEYRYGGDIPLYYYNQHWIVAQGEYKLSTSIKVNVIQIEKTTPLLNCPFYIVVYQKHIYNTMGCVDFYDLINYVHQDIKQR